MHFIQQDKVHNPVKTINLNHIRWLCLVLHPFRFFAAPLLSSLLACPGNRQCCVLWACGLSLCNKINLPCNDTVLRPKGTWTRCFLSSAPYVSSVHFVWLRLQCLHIIIAGSYQWRVSEWMSIQYCRVKRWSSSRSSIEFLCKNKKKSTWTRIPINVIDDNECLDFLCCYCCLKFYRMKQETIYDKKHFENCKPSYSQNDGNNKYLVNLVDKFVRNKSATLFGIWIRYLPCAYMSGPEKRRIRRFFVIDATTTIKRGLRPMPIISRQWERTFRFLSLSLSSKHSKQIFRSNFERIFFSAKFFLRWHLLFYRITALTWTGLEVLHKLQITLLLLQSFQLFTC